jgi:hypothetical protein
MQLKFHCHVFAAGVLIINFYTNCCCRSESTTKSMVINFIWETYLILYPLFITTFSILCMLRAYIVSKNYWIASAIYTNVHYWKVKYLFNVKSSNQSIFVDENSHVSTNSFFAMKIPGTLSLKKINFSKFSDESSNMLQLTCFALQYGTAYSAPIFADLSEYH